MRKVGLGVLALLMACKGSGDLFECPEGEICEDGEVLVRERVRGASIQKITVYQSVAVPIAKEGEAISPSLPILAGRKTLLRVFLDSSDDFVSRDIVGRLTLEHGEDDTTVHEVTFSLNGNWNESSLSSTMNFFLEEEDVTPSTTFHVELLEVEPGFEGDESRRNNVVYPLEGMADLRAESMAKPLKVYMLPIKYNADGSGRTPNMTENRLNEFAEDMKALYPTGAVEFTLLPEKSWNQAIEPYGNGTSPRLLSAVF